MAVILHPQAENVLRMFRPLKPLQHLLYSVTPMLKQMLDGSFKSLTYIFITAIAVCLEICESDAVCSPDAESEEEEEEEGPSESDHWRGPAPTVEEKSRWVPFMNHYHIFNYNVEYICTQMWVFSKTVHLQTWCVWFSFREEEFDEYFEDMFLWVEERKIQKNRMHTVFFL